MMSLSQVIVNTMALALFSHPVWLSMFEEPGWLHRGKTIEGVCRWEKTCNRSLLELTNAVGDTIRSATSIPQLALYFIIPY